MAKGNNIRYFNIKEGKPDVKGYAIKVDSSVKPQKLECMDLPEMEIKLIKNNKKGSVYQLINDGYTIPRPTAGCEMLALKPCHITKIEGEKSILKIHVNPEGELKLAEGYKGIFKRIYISEISQSKAYDIKESAMNWRAMQCWV